MGEGLNLDKAGSELDKIEDLESELKLKKERLGYVR